MTYKKECSNCYHYSCHSDICVKYNVKQAIDFKCAEYQKLNINGLFGSKIKLMINNSAASVCFQTIGILDFIPKHGGIIKFLNTWYKILWIGEGCCHAEPIVISEDIANYILCTLQELALKTNTIHQKDLQIEKITHEKVSLQRRLKALEA